MAITQTISTIPNAGKRGVDVRDTFVTKQEAFQDALSDVFVSEINIFKDQLNITQTAINTKESSCTLSASSAESSKNLALQYKNDTNNYYLQAKSYIDSLVIPTVATYSISEINAKARMSQVLALTGAI